MSDPITFDATTARFKLPLLFAGQSQKEVYVNEGFLLADSLMHCIVESETNTPPTSPVDGNAWLVGSSPTGEWAGEAGTLALRQAGQWLFAAPRDGMRIVNRASGQDLRRLAGHGSPRVRRQLRVAAV